MGKNKEIFAQILQSVRLQKGLTQTQLAEKLTVKTKAYGHWETGLRSPDIDDLFELAEALDVSVDFLMGRTDDPRVRKPRKAQPEG